MPFIIVIGYIVYFGLGLIQLSAIYAGLSEWMGLHWIITSPLSFFLSYLPLVGTVLGTCGAVYAWHWSWVKALLLFFGPWLLIMSGAAVIVGYEALTKKSAQKHIE